MKRRKNISRFLAAILVCVLSLICCGCSKQTRATKEMQTMTFGIDVARYQGTIDWQQVSGSGIDFAIVRVGYRGMADGELTEDPNGRYNLQEAAKAGIPLGAYFFSTALTTEEAQEEADWVAQILAGYPITYPVVYDCEGFRQPESRQYFMSAEERTDVALAFLKRMEELGYESMFYASKNDLESSDGWEISRIEEDYKIWVAQYPAVPYPDTPSSSYAGTHQMWQYATDGAIAGIDQPVDLNVAYFGYDGVEPAKSKEPPEEVKPNVEAMMDFEEVQESVTAKEETNLRSIPSQDTDSVVVAKLKNGEVIQRIAVSSSGWSKLMYQGEVCYAVSSYLTTDLKYGYDTDIVIRAEANADDIQTQFQEVNQQVTAKDAVNLRSLPSVEHEDVEVIAQLKNGDVATCIGISDNGWSKLNYRGTICYAISSYLTQAAVMQEKGQSEETFDIAFRAVQETVTAQDKVNLRSIPSTERKDSQILTQLYNGDTAIRIGISDNGWSKLQYNGMTCYAASMYLITVEAAEEPSGNGSGQIQTRFEEINDQVTAKDEVNLRSMPSVEDPNCIVLGKLKNGEVVTRTGINRDLGWSRVEYQGKTAYCISSYLTAAQ